MSKYPEQELITELVNLFPSDVEPFLAIVLPAGLQNGYLVKSKDSRSVFKAFTDLLKGSTPASQKPILEAIIQARDGCVSAKKWLDIVMHQIEQGEVAPEPPPPREVLRPQQKVEGLTHVLPDNLHLTKKRIAAIVKLCVEPSDNYEVCVHPAATHSTGAAAAGLVAWMLSANVCYLQKQLTTTFLELAKRESSTKRH